MSVAPFISIVVPIYNVCKYLQECVDSLLGQDYVGFEVVLVDDGSTDGSGELCDRLAASDSRVRVVHKSNGGLSSARNAGVAASSGDYLMFVDGDDWIDPTTISSCVAALRVEDASRCVVSFAYVREYSCNPLPRHLWDDDRIFEGGDYWNCFYRRLFGPAGEDLRHPEAIHSLETCWGKLYPIEAARAGRYFDTKEVGSSEDGLFNIYALRECTSAIYIDECLYHYRKDVVSLSTAYRPGLQRQWGRLFDEFNRAAAGLGSSFESAVNNRIALSIVDIGLNELSNSSASVPVQVTRISSWIRGERYRKAISSLNLDELPGVWRPLLWAAKAGLPAVVYAGLLTISFLKGRS